MTRPAVVRMVESSGRFDRSPASLLRAARRYALRSNFQVHTEVARNTRSNVLTRLLGWGVVHFEDARMGEDECAILFRRLFWRKVSARADRLSGKGIARRSGALCYSVDALFENRRTKQRVMVCAFHLPTRGDAQNAIWWECAHRLADKVALWQMDGTADCIILVGDWNTDWRDYGDRNDLHFLFPTGRFSWGMGRMPAREGTHGRRLIDHAIVWGGTITRAELLADDASSDHRPWFMRVEVGAR